MKKRMVPVVMAVIMALSLTACGADKTVSSAAISESAESSVEEKAETVEKEVSAETSVDETSEEADAETSTEASVKEAESEKDDVLVFGKTEDGVYSNEFFGATITPMDGYSFADEEQLALINNFTQEKMANSDSDFMKLISEQVKSGQNVIDVHVSDSMGLNTLMMNCAFLGEGVSREFASTLAEVTAKSSKQLYSSQGLDVQSCEVVTMEISGIEVPCVKTVAGITVGENVVDTYMLQAILIKDGYGATITSGTYFTDNTEKQFEMITLSE